MRSMRWWAAVFVLAVAAPLLRAQQGGAVIVSGPPGAGHVTKSADRPQGVSSPVPALLVSGRKVFLSNGGAEAGLFPHPFTGTQDRAYGFVYEAIKAGKRFDLVGSPAEADLVMELTLSAPTGSLGGDKQHGTEDALPVFKLIIYDRPTHYVLWTMSQTIDKANLQKTHDKNFDDALTLLLNQLTTVSSPIEPAK
jgi:hypothetical protein